jgi:hypothetical protein
LTIVPTVENDPPVTPITALTVMFLPAANNALHAELTDSCVTLLLRSIFPLISSMQ